MPPLFYEKMKVAAQTSIKSRAVDPALSSNVSPGQKLLMRDAHGYFSRSWMSLAEPITLWSNDTFTVRGILEHLNVTKDHSDYLWYFTRCGLIFQKYCYA